MLNFISQLQPAYLYPAVFVGHMFLGGFVLIPALYLSTLGKMSFFVLFAIIVISSMISDSFWYFIGKNIKRHHLYSLPIIRNRVTEAKKLSRFFDTHGVRTVFFTKFISGTRLASHILAGTHEVSYVKFLLATGAGTSVWFTVMFMLMRWLDKGIAGSSIASFRIQAVAIAAVVLLVAMNWLTRKYFKGRLMESKAEGNQK